MTELLTPENLVALITLIVLEIILGVDNVIFIAVLSGNLPEKQQENGRRLGIALAVVSRIILLLGIGFIIQLTEPLFELFGHEFTARDLIVVGGGLFLIGKSSWEIFHKLEGEEQAHSTKRDVMSMASFLFQIILLDLVFSLDSVITGIGITPVIPIIVIAIIVAAVVMVLFSGVIARFVEKHPSMKILALSFLIMIGVLLVAEGINPHAVEDLQLRNYVYFAMAFAFAIELINIRIRNTSNPVHLHNTWLNPDLPSEDTDGDLYASPD